MTAAELGPRRPPGRLSEVAVGVVVGALGVAAALLVLAVSDDVTYAPLVGAVAVSVWAGGERGGVTAVITAWLLASRALTDSGVRLPLGLEIDLRWGVALVFGAIVAAVGFGMRRGHRTRCGRGRPG